MNVVTRIAPSPTGYFHFGLARTALFSYFFARKHGGTFIVRIEDTDVARNKPEYEADIFEQLTWLGLEYDTAYVQSKNRTRHAEAIKTLIEKDLAYESEEPSKEDPTRTVKVIRLQNKGETITFNDHIRGPISFDTSELGDFVIARSTDDPLYHLAVVVDDYDEGVTHIVRGDDHISNTPRHILIQRALGFPTPEYAHIPLILMPDKSKMSKRKHESAVKNYRDRGFLPEAVINHLAFLGWNPGGERELYTKEELVPIFTFEQVQKHGAVHNDEKLLWFNREYIKRLDHGRFKEEAGKFLNHDTVRKLEETGRLESVLALIRERISTFGEIADMEAAGEFAYYVEAPVYDPQNLHWKKVKAHEDTRRHLEAIFTLLEPVLEGAWTKDTVKEVVWGYVEKEGRGDVLWPVRFALSGCEKSPDPFTLADILGKDETLARIKTAIKLLS